VWGIIPDRDERESVRPRRDRDHRPTRASAVWWWSTTTTNVRGKGEPVVAKRNVLNELLRGALVILARRGETTEGKFVEENIFFNSSAHVGDFFFVCVALCKAMSGSRSMPLPRPHTYKASHCFYFLYIYAYTKIGTEI